MSRLRLFIVTLALIALAAVPAHAQNGGALDGLAPVTRTYAITGARIVQAPGEVIERGTVVVQDGLIRAVGQDVEIPYDARRIDGDSLTVYAGFINGLSHAGVETPEPPEEKCSDDNIERPGDPPPVCAGIQPGRHASELLDLSGDAVEDLRAIGFTTAHVVPEGGMLPGTGAIILLGGEEATDIVLEPRVSLFAQFNGADGVYPATDMGVIAKLEELYRQARQRRRLEAAYEEDPSGMRRPAYEAALAPFFPVIAGERPMVFHAEGALDIHRALSLQEQLGFPIALAGLRQAFDAMEALSEANPAALFLTLELPEPPDDAEGDSPIDSVTVDPAHAATPDQTGSYFLSDLRVISYKDVDEERENLQARQALIREQYYRTAGLLEAAGLRFGFTTLDADPDDVRANLRKMIEHGLSKEDALAALTTDAAALLGLSERLGTVEEGKIANLVVTTGPYFEEDSEIRYVFVDGRPFEYEVGEAESEAEAGEVQAAGTWALTIATRQGEMEATLTLEGDPDESGLSGTITTQRTGEVPLEEVQLEGSELTFTFEAEEMGQIEAALTLAGDELEGTFDVPGFGEIPVTGERTSPDF